MQNRIENKGKLLNSDGNLAECGYSTSLIKEYDRADIKKRASRIKEWDYYLIYNDNYAVALTIADNGYMGMLSASVIDFDKPGERTKSIMTFFPMGKFRLPKSSAVGDIHYCSKKVRIDFCHTNGGRKLRFWMKNFSRKDDLDVNFTLSNEPADSMVIATPFNKPKHFYYNQKIIGFAAKGNFKVGAKEVQLDNARGLLDWGRGVWTYRNTWYWGAAMGKVAGKEFGFNIGYGFGDTSAATENMLFYAGKAHKLDQVVFIIPQINNKDDFMSPWTFTSSDGRFEMDFVPIINRHANADIGIICSKQNQVFGRFSGKAILDDGTELVINNLLGFAEKVYNKW